MVCLGNEQNHSVIFETAFKYYSCLKNTKKPGKATGCSQSDFFLLSEVTVTALYVLQRGSPSLLYLLLSIYQSSYQDVHLEPKHALSRACGSLTTPGAQVALSLLMVKWTGSRFCSDLSGVALALLGAGLGAGHLVLYSSPLTLW